MMLSKLQTIEKGSAGPDVHLLAICRRRTAPQLSKNRPSRKTNELSSHQGPPRTQCHTFRQLPPHRAEFLSGC